MVNWYYALTCFLVVFVTWFYVGTANPAVKPGITAEFNFFAWLKSAIFRCFGLVLINNNELGNFIRNSFPILSF